MFLFAHTPTTKLYPLSLHDALPIYAVLTDIQGNQLTLSDYKGKPVVVNLWATWCPPCIREMPVLDEAQQANQDIDRKSTRLNSSHVRISYAVFCLKKKIRVNTDDPT